VKYIIPRHCTVFIGLNIVSIILSVLFNPSYSILIIILNIGLIATAIGVIIDYNKE